MSRSKSRDRDRDRDRDDRGRSRDRRNKDPEYELYYFDFRGRGEFIRYMLCYADVDFTDRVVDEKEWKKLKATTPFGQLPILSVGKLQLAQSATIGRYLANEFGLTGKNKTDAAICDMYIDAYKDMYQSLGPIVNALLDNNNKKVKAEWKELQKGVVGDFVGKFEEVMDDNRGKWLVGNNVTWADFAVGEILGRFTELLDKDLLKDFPRLKGMVRRLHELPGVEDWVKDRPDRAF